MQIPIRSRTESGLRGRMPTRVVVIGGRGSGGVSCGRGQLVNGLWSRKGAYCRVGTVVGEGSGKGSEVVGRSRCGHMSSTQVILNYLYFSTVYLLYYLYKMTVCMLVQCTISMIRSGFVWAKVIPRIQCPRGVWLSGACKSTLMSFFKTVYISYYCFFHQY